MGTSCNNVNTTILITRPLLMSQKTAHLLSMQGYKVFIEPLSIVKPCSFQLPQDLSLFDALCASSAAAFLAMSEVNSALQNNKYNFQQLKKLPIFCVGSKTAQAAQKAGFETIVASAKNAQSLVRIILASPYKNLLYFCGQHRREILENSLKAAARFITPIETYTNSAIIPKSDHSEKPTIIDIVLLYSTIGLNGLELLDKQFSDTTKFLCLSKRIGESLPPQYQQQAIIAHQPNEQSLLKLIYNQPISF